MVGAQSVAAKTLVQHLFHAPFALDPFHRVIEEILVERDPRLRVPPGWMQNHVHGPPASQVEELGWGEHRTPAAAVDSANNAFINGLHGIMQFGSVR